MGKVIRILDCCEKVQPPDCYKCKYRRSLPYDSHSECKNLKAGVAGKAHGIDHGWFFWPFNFDPVWLVACTGFEVKEGA